MQNKSEARKIVAKLLIDVVLQKLSVSEALKKFPKDTEDLSVSVCFHILVHFEADEDIREKDPMYKETQDDFIVSTAETLLKGEDLPYNIIQEYKDFYNSDLIYHTDTKENILKKLGKFINL